MTTMVPPLNEMRAMSDAELLTLKTTLSYDRGVIAGQIKFAEDEPAEGVREEQAEWLRRAGYAQHVREYGLASIRNILAERQATRGEFSVPLERWLSVMQDVINAARPIMEEEGGSDPEEWDELELALERYDNFAVKYELVARVVTG